MRRGSMTFSGRTGPVPEKAIQVDGMDNNLRIGLWNAFISTFERPPTLGGTIWREFLQTTF
jgi:hypothetical protein